MVLHNLNGDLWYKFIKTIYLAIPFNYSYWSLAFTNELMDEHASKGAFNNAWTEFCNFLTPTLR